MQSTQLPLAQSLGAVQAVWLTHMPLVHSCGTPPLEHCLAPFTHTAQAALGYVPVQPFADDFAGSAERDEVGGAENVMFFVEADGVHGASEG